MEATFFWDRIVDRVKLAAQNPSHPALADFHKEIKGGVDLANANGDTPLMMTSKVGHTEASKMLLGMGARIDAQNNNGLTALMMGVHNNHVEIVKLLLANNANVNLTTADGLNALRVAKIGTGLTKLFSRSKIIAMLHQAGAR